MELKIKNAAEINYPLSIIHSQLSIKENSQLTKWTRKQSGKPLSRRWSAWGCKRSAQPTTTQAQIKHPLPQRRMRRAGDLH